MKFEQPKLQSFFHEYPIYNTLSEWGAPIGQMGRIIPALVIKASCQQCLWITDNKDYLHYPPYWEGLGLDLKKIFFLYDDNPFKHLRIPLRSSQFSMVIFDLKSFISPANMNYLSHYSRKHNVTCLLIRPFFLSARNGNPFAKIRFNCSYSLKKDSICLTPIKGNKKTPFNLSYQELTYG